MLCFSLNKTCKPKKMLRGQESEPSWWLGALRF